MYMRFCVGLVVGAVVTLLFGFAGGWCWKSGLAPFKVRPQGRDWLAHGWIWGFP